MNGKGSLQSACEPNRCHSPESAQNLFGKPSLISLLWLASQQHGYKFWIVSFKRSLLVRHTSPNQGLDDFHNPFLSSFPTVGTKQVSRSLYLLWKSKLALFGPFPITHLCLKDPWIWWPSGTSRTNVFQCGASVPLIPTGTWLRSTAFLCPCW